MHSRRAGFLALAAWLLVTPLAASQEIDAASLRALAEAGRDDVILERLSEALQAERVPAFESLVIGMEAGLRAGRISDARWFSEVGERQHAVEPLAWTWSGHVMNAMAAHEGEGPSGLFHAATLRDAANAYRRARELGGDTYWNARWEADALLRAGAADEGLEVVRVALAGMPDSRDARLLEVRCLLEADRSAEAAEAAEALVAAEPRGDLEAARLLMTARMRQDDREVARASFLELIVKHPSDGEIYRTFVGPWLGDRPDTWLRGTLEAALEANAADRYPLWYLGWLDEVQGHASGALGHYLAYRDGLPTDPEGHLLVGRVLTNLGRLGEAREALLKANSLGGLDAGQLATALQALVFAHVQKVDFGPAERLQGVVVSLTESPADLLDLGALQIEAGDTDAGLNTYRALLERDDLDPALRAKTWNYLALGLWGRGDLAGGEDALRASVDKEAADLDAWENLGLLLGETGHPVEAERVLLRVLAEDPARVRSRYHLLRLRHPGVFGGN